MVSFTHLHVHSQYSILDGAAAVADLVKKALELQATYKGGTLAPTLATMTFLKDWLSTHIMKSDKAYTAFMVSKGMK